MSIINVGLTQHKKGKIMSVSSIIIAKTIMDQSNKNDSMLESIFTKHNWSGFSIRMFKQLVSTTYEEFQELILYYGFKRSPKSIHPISANEVFDNFNEYIEIMFDEKVKIIVSQKSYVITNIGKKVA